ncbi:MAG: hypothetical protein C0513_06455 [Isosphaera sp.]|nr:hypothetical protein [Isosphaera sp.]
MPADPVPHAAPAPAANATPRAADQATPKPAHAAADLSAPAASPGGLSRRSVLAAGAALAGSSLITAPRLGPKAQATPSAPAAGTPRPKAKNLIFAVVDGMSAGTLTLADLAWRRRTGRPAQWLELLLKPGVRRALMSTHSADSLVTDSAAAAAVWSTGIKHHNGRLCWLEDGRTPEPLLLRARRSGKRVGCVTTTTITHATPAGFYANSPNRNEERAIAEQLLARRLDVALGGGARFFPDSLLAAPPAIDPRADAPTTPRGQWRLVRTAAELAAATPDHTRPLLGLFSASHLSMFPDRAAAEPSLTDLATAAVAHLSAAADADGSGYVLQVEGGRVDHAGHGNDAPGLLQDMLEFDRTVAALAQLALERDDTLLIVTTDHGTANPGLTLYKDAASAGLDRLLNARHSAEWILRTGAPRSERPDPDATAQAIAARAAEALAVTLTAEDIAALKAAVAGQPADPFQARRGLSGVLGSVLSNHTAVGFISSNHSADHAEVLALGPGSEALPPFLDNADLHALAASALGLRAPAL